jgi:hypothetical protein
VPPAVTANVAVFPLTSETLAGCMVIVGAIAGVVMLVPPQATSMAVTRGAITRRTLRRRTFSKLNMVDRLLNHN